MTYQILPKPDCRSCYGTGEVVDYVPYGNTDVPMPSICECVADQIARYEDLVKEVKSLFDQLIDASDRAFEDKDYGRMTRIDHIIDKVSLRKWRRLNVLKAAGHMDALW